MPLQAFLQLVHDGLGVAQQHGVVLLEEERVLDVSLAGAHGALDHDALLGLPHLQHGHACDGAVGVLDRARVHDVVGTQHQGHVAFGEVLVDLLQLVHDVLRDAHLR